MKEKSARSKLREYPVRPTIMDRVIAAVGFAIVGAFFSVIAASLMVPIFYGVSVGTLLAMIIPFLAYGFMVAAPAWILMGMSLALLPRQRRYRQLIVKVVILVTGILVSYLLQKVDLPGSTVVHYGGGPVPFQFFSKITLVSVVSTSIGGYFLSKFTKDFAI